MTLTTTPRTTTPAVATGASQTVPFAFRAFAARQQVGVADRHRAIDDGGALRVTGGRLAQQGGQRLGQVGR